MPAKKRKPRRKRAGTDFKTWAERFFHELDQDKIASEARRTLSGAGCDSFSACVLLWQYSEVNTTGAFAEHFRRDAKEAKRLAKKARELAADIETFNQNQGLSSLEDEGQPWYAVMVGWDARMLPDHQRRYADLLDKVIAPSASRYATKRKWTGTGRLVMLAFWVREVSGEPHWAELTDLLRVADVASGRGGDEADVDNSFIQNTVEQFRSTNPLWYREIRVTCRLYARLRQKNTPDLPPFIFWERVN